MPELMYDAELLDQMLNDSAVMRNGHVLTAKAISFHTGVAVQTISDYRRGRYTIPVRFWRQVWNLTRDPRIASLLIGDTPCEITFTDSIRDIAGDASLLAAAVDSLSDFHAQEKYLLEILRDGRIDEADRKSINAYNAAFVRARQTQNEVHKSVNRAFVDACKEQAT